MDAPVVIVGNGPVGQTSALLLARWGIPSIVLEKQPHRELVGSKSICQQREVLDIWEAVGAGRTIAEEGVTWTTARTYYQDAELFSVTFADRGRPAFPPFVNISQSRTEEILARRVAAEPLIEERWAHESVGLHQDDDSVTVVCTTPSGEVRVRASYCLVAAGVSTDCRGMLGVRYEGESFDDQFLICDIRAELPGWEFERRFYFDPEWNPGRQVLIHPCPESTYRIDWQVPPDFDLAAEEAGGHLDARIRKIVGDRGYEVVWRSVYRFHERVADRFRVGRYLLVGDTAHVFAPFGARGLNSGVQDAENAAWKLAFVLRGWAPDVLLDSYHDERHAAALENLDITATTMRFLVPQTEREWQRRRDVLERAAHEPSAKGEVDSGRLSEPFWYVDSPLTTPDAGRPFPGRPERGAAPPVVPGVLVPDVPISLPGDPGISRLRQVVRDGLLALTADAVEPDAVAQELTAVSSAPANVLPMADIDSEGLLADALSPLPGEVWLIRPDGHLAAVVPAADPGRLRQAALRALGHI